MQKTTIRSKDDLGHAVRRRRREFGWTQGELGARAGLAAKHVSRIENGVLEARLSTVLALAAALELDVSVAARSGGAAGKDGSVQRDPDAPAGTAGPDGVAKPSGGRKDTGAADVF